MQPSEDTVWEGTRFRVVRLQEDCGAAGRRERHVVRHPGSVVILPLLDDQRLCLIRNQRIAVGERLVELPAGTREPAEPPEVTARRELEEETGFLAGHIEPVLSFFVAPGILDERMHLYVATQLTSGPPRREPGEDIENLVVTRDEALAMVADGRIRDAKTIIGLLYWVHLQPEQPR